MRTRVVLALLFLLGLGTATLRAQAPNPNENPEGNTGALKAQVTTGGSYDAHSGNATRTVTDLQVPGALGVYGLAFTRYWNSVHPEDTDLAAVWSLDFGNSGWSHSWKWSAVFDYEEPDHESHPPPYVYVSSITITFPDGHATKYKISRGTGDWRVGPPYYASHGETNWPSPGPHVHDHLAEMAENGTEFWLYREDGGMVRFTGGPSEYQATEIYDPYGFKTDLHYNVYGDLDQVTQEGGRYLNIVWGVLPDGLRAITRVETGGGGLAGSQQVTYKYSKPGGDYVLSKVTYPDTPTPGQTASAIYTYGYSYQGDQPGVGPQSDFPLLKYADDPHYAGAMTRIRYDYRGEGCIPNPSPPPNMDPYAFAPESIQQERSGETGETVSLFQGVCTVGSRMDYNGTGGVRTIYYGRSANDPLLPGIESYQLSKMTIFGLPGADPSSLPAGRQTGSQPSKVWDALLHRTDITYDNSGGAAQITHTVDGSSQFYDRVTSGGSAPPDTTRIRNPYHHWVFSKRDELNNVITYTRDARRRVTRIDHPGGTYEEYSYNAFNQVETHRLPSGAVQVYQYNALHQLELEYNSVQGLNERKEYYYDGLGRVERTRDARAIHDNAPYTERMEYNGRHQVIKVHYRVAGGSSDPTVTNEYDKYGNCTAVIDELGHRKDSTYDAYGRCTSRTEQVGSVAGCNGVQVRRTDWIYDRVVTFGGSDHSYPASAHTSKEWRVQIEPAFNADGHRRATSRTFDVNNRMLSEQTGLIQLPGATLGILELPGQEAETHWVTYDANGQKSSTTDPRGRVTTYEYDVRNRLWKTNETVNTSMPRTTETLYDVAGNKTLVKFPDLKTQRWEDYDAFGQPGRSIDERNNTTHLYYRWGPMKELASVITHRTRDGGGTEDQLTQFWQDTLGRPTETVFPDGTFEQTTYELGQLKTYKTRRGQTKVIDLYDERGREKHHYWLTPQYAVDSQTPAISQLWDDASRLTKIWNSFSLVEYAYDDAGGMRTEGTTVTGTGLNEVRYCRYPDGQVSQVTYPNGTVVSRSYTARGQLKDVGWGIGATSYVYWPDGRVNVQVRTNGVTTSYGYNERGMINLVQHSKGGHDLARRDYWRDNRDRIVAWKRGTDQTYNGMEDGRGNRYGYDDEGQLTSASYRALNPETGTPSGAMRTDSFSYDQLGNRQGQAHVANRGQWMAMGRRDNGLNQYINWSNDPEHPVPDPLHWGSPIFHDDNMPMPSPTPTPPVAGNGVTTADGYITASYNALNQPVGMWSQVYSGTSNYLWFGYDPLGRCVKRWKGPASAGTPGYNPATYFYYDGSDIVQEGAGATSVDRVYVHGGRVDEIVASNVSGVWYNHHYDAQGSCILLSTATGGLQEQYDYDAFGYPYFYTPSGGKGGNVKTRFLFTGREWISDMKIYDYRARMYQPELGRFLQPDPQEFAAGDYNLYRYCHNDPVNKSDPTGLREELVGETHRDIMWDMARYMDSSNNEQGSFANFTNNAYIGAYGGGDRYTRGQYTMAGQAQKGGPENAQNQAVRQGDGYSSSPVDAALQREGDAKKIARGDTEGVVEIGQDKTNPRQFYATVAHDGNKDPSNFKDKVKQDNAPVATSWIDPAHLPKNYTLVGGLIAHRLYSAGRAGEDIQRAKDHNWRTFIVTAPERKVPVIYDKYTNPNPKF